MDKNNKRIILNTGVMYVRLIVTTIIGLLTSRYVLLALGASDFGLYAVVGGLISMLNVLSTAMYTTTRRYINVEMGKTDGNLNHIFNISRLLHIGFALFIFVIAETVGLFYIYNYLNVAPERFDDAVFVFHISTIAAAIGIINVPYQALMEAYEKFNQIAFVDVLRSTVKLIFVYCLMFMGGDSLRVYAIGMALLTVLLLSFYNIACFCQWKDIVRYKFYKDSGIYREILVFNNYVAMGATAYIARTEASTMLVNYFFGTLVNAAFTIGYTIESYCMTFVSSIGTAASPQITKNYFSNYERSLQLMEAINRYSVFMMLLVIVPISAELEFILRLWLKDVPEGTALVCHLTLISALTRVLFGSVNAIFQASGKNKWFQIVGSIIQLMCIPIGFILYRIGFPAITIIVLYIIGTLVDRCAILYLLHRILNFNVVRYVRNVHMSILPVVLCSIAIIIIYRQIDIDGALWRLLGILLCFSTTIIVIFFMGMCSSEKSLIKARLLGIIRQA